MPTRLRYLSLFVACTLLYCAGNWILPLFDRDEPRFSEASREMLQRNDWLVPYFNGKERFDKPPLIYWAQAACYKALGENSFAARLPAALFGAATVLVILVWGSRLYGPGTGWRAALMFALCFQMLIHGRSAVADMPMIFFSTLAAWAGWELIAASRLSLPDERRPGWGWLFWSALGFAFLAKGPIALIPIGMVGFVAIRRGKVGNGWPSWVAGFLLMLAIIAAWGLPANLQTDWEYARVALGKHVGTRYISAMEGHGAKSVLTWILSCYFYFATLFYTFFPWALWVPIFVWRLLKTRRPWDESTLYLWTGIVLVFAIFTVSRTKLPHYTLPCYPFLALLLANWWAENRSEQLFRRWAIGMTAGGLAISTIGFSIAAPYFPAHALCEKTKGWMDPQTEVAMVGFEEPSITWEFRKELKTFQTPLKGKEAAKWMAMDGPRACIFREEDLKKLFRVGTGDWKVARVSGRNPANGFIPKNAKVNAVLVYKAGTPGTPAAPVAAPVQAEEPL